MITDLEEVIKVTQQAVDAILDDHPDRAALLNNLGIHLGNKYLRMGAIIDLEEAIKVARQAVDATPDDHPGRAGRWNNLRKHLGNKYSYLIYVSLRT